MSLTDPTLELIKGHPSPSSRDSSAAQGTVGEPMMSSHDILHGCYSNLPSRDATDGRLAVQLWQNPIFLDSLLIICKVKVLGKRIYKVTSNSKIQNFPIVLLPHANVTQVDLCIEESCQFSNLLCSKYF